jgi:nicotinamidase-related amidase
MKYAIPSPTDSNKSKKFTALVIDLQYDPKVDSNHKLFNPLGFSKAFDQVLNQIQLFKELGIPFALVQYGYSPFTPGLVEASGDAPVFTKTRNSALSLGAARDFISDSDTLILSGYSCGVCVRETALDAIKMSKRVWYSADTVFGEAFPNDLTNLQLFVASLSFVKSLGPNVLGFSTLSQMEEDLRSSVI